MVKSFQEITLEVTGRVIPTPFDVIRRVGGLEVMVLAIANGVVVIRRVGGLEEIQTFKPYSGYVIRRVGGLEEQRGRCQSRYAIIRAQ